MNEFVLFLKMTLNKSLNTEQSNKIKHKKFLINMNLMCNVSRSHKLKP